MIDTLTNKPLYVSTDGNAGPYIMLPESQLEKVKNHLDVNNISYWVDEEAISLDGKPEVAVINLGHGSDPEKIQNILDNIP
jgi:hypothetical protein